jgi:hypothetical protein
VVRQRWRDAAQPTVVLAVTIRHATEEPGATQDASAKASTDPRGHDIAHRPTLERHPTFIEDVIVTETM